MPISTWTQKLLFILGKGGVGKTTVCASLASYFAQQEGQRVLLVQWALRDAVSPLYNLPPCTHRAVPIAFHGYEVMNFNVHEAIREYFVEHLKMKLLYSLVVENRQMQKLIRAAPGIQELFFLGRLFWLVELILQERGYCYDKILVDTPAMGHGVSLFETAGAVARLGMAGPLATECERVSKLLKNPEKTGVLFVTLPEELPVEESLDFLPQMTQHLQRPPLAVFMNQSINKIFFKNLDLLSTERWFLDLQSRFEHVQSSLELQFILSRLTKRHFFETKFIEQLQSNSDERYQKIPVLFLPDVSLFQKIHKPLDVIEFLLQHFSSSV